MVDGRGSQRPRVTGIPLRKFLIEQRRISNCIVKRLGGIDKPHSSRERVIRQIPPDIRNIHGRRYVQRGQSLLIADPRMEEDVRRPHSTR